MIQLFFITLKANIKKNTKLIYEIYVLLLQNWNSFQTDKGTLGSKRINKKHQEINVMSFKFTTVKERILLGRRRKKIRPAA